MRFLRKNTAVIITVGPFYDKTDGVTIETALTITNERITLTADTDDGSAPTNILDNIAGATSATANDLNYITGNDAGMMQLELAAANVNRLGRMFLSITDAANHVPVFHEFMVVNAALYDAFFATTGGAIPNAAADAAGGLVISDAGALDLDAQRADVAAILVDTGTTLDGRIPAALTANGNMKSSLMEILTTALTETAGLLAGGFKKFFNVATPTGTVNSLADAVPGAAGGGFIAGSNAATTANITGNITGNLSGSVGSVTGAVGSVTGAVGSVTGAVGSVTGAVGSVTGAVGSIANGGIVAASFAAGAIDAAAIAADAIGASELAADAVAEIADAVWDEDATAHQTQGTFGQAIGDPALDANTIFKAVVSDATGATVGVDGAAILADTNELQTDWVNGGRLDLLIDAIKAKTDALPADPADASDVAAAIAALNDLSAAQVNAEVVDALATDTYAEPTGTPAATIALATKVGWMYMALRNGLSVTASKKQFLDDGGAGEWSKTLADDGVTYSESEATTP